MFYLLLQDAAGMKLSSANTPLSAPPGFALVPAECWSRPTCGVVVWMCSRHMATFSTSIESCTGCHTVLFFLAVKSLSTLHVDACGSIIFHYHPLSTKLCLGVTVNWSRCPWWFATTCPTTANCTSTASDAVVVLDERVWPSTLWRSLTSPVVAPPLLHNLLKLLRVWWIVWLWPSFHDIS